MDAWKTRGKEMLKSLPQLNRPSFAFPRRAPAPHEEPSGPEAPPRTPPRTPSRVKEGNRWRLGYSISPPGCLYIDSAWPPG